MSIAIQTIRAIILVAVGASLGSASQSAQAKKSRAQPFLDEIIACQSISDAEQRLACFDKSVAAAADASKKGALKIVTREELLKSRRELFGFPVSESNFIVNDDYEHGKDKIDRLDTTIKSVRSGANASWILTTAEGAVWEIYDVPSRLMTPKVGEKLQISKGVLTAYFLRIGGQPAVKGRRIQ